MIEAHAHPSHGIVAIEALGSEDGWVGTEVFGDGTGPDRRRRQGTENPL